MKTIGIIGAGQLGQMLGMAGRTLGLGFVFLDPADEPPAAVAGPVLNYAFDSEQGLAEMAALADVITYEFENVPVTAIEKLQNDIAVYPPAEALRHAQDRLEEKTLFAALGIPVPAYRPVDSPADLHRAADEIGLPLVLKTRRFGYDGKGQVVVRSPAEIESACRELGGKALIAEQWVAFDREISAIAARNTDGDIVHYPLTENTHDNGILSVSRAPAEEAANLAETAEGYVNALMAHFDYVGVLALELFVSADGLLANEFAPRVHNSGHWTIEGAHTSQFENHLRAVLGMPLGHAQMQGFAGMVNLIGKMPETLTAPENVQLHIHDYGKAPRPGRKLGHATIVAKTAADRDRALESVLSQVRG